MKIIKAFLVLALALGLFVAGWFSNRILNKIQTKDIPSVLVEKIRPLEKYTTENLASAAIKPGKLTFDAESKFVMEFEPAMDGNIKKVSGRITLPREGEQHPIVVMIRGYVDQTIYTTGIGTQKAADFFTENGFITVAPDFLGYADSDREAGNIFESRFQTSTTILSLLKSLDQIPAWDGTNVFIWAHSNGGQIALTALEVTGGEIPTTLWAPVTKPFPYSVLYYTDESEDRGKLIRGKLAEFEEDYDVEKYSLTNFFDRIKAPIQLHQGTADDAIPLGWSNSFAKKLLGLELDLNYYVYPGADHNLKSAWNTVVARDLAFFNSHLKVDN